MPYRPHMAGEPPANPNQTLWRYLTLPKLLFILEYRALPFVRLDKMPDRFEGAPSQAAIESSLIHRPDLNMNREQWIQIAQHSYAVNQLHTFVSCWHQNNHESGAMWAQYSDEGVAIKTTYSRLIESIEDDPHSITVGVVKYSNHSRDYGLGNTLVHAFRKRLYYQYEQELRAVLVDIPEQLQELTITERLEAAKDAPAAVDVKVDLKRLIPEIYVSPGRPRWYHQLVADVLRRYDLGILPTPSWLDKRPHYE